MDIKTALTNGDAITAKPNGDIVNGGGKLSWYKDVIELRKKAGEYKARQRNDFYFFAYHIHFPLLLVPWMGRRNPTGHHK